ncbi:MAG: hypothetical protein ACOYXT_23930 [Bacteroidota bacterium]
MATVKEIFEYANFMIETRKDMLKQRDKELKGKFASQKERDAQLKALRNKAPEDYSEQEKRQLQELQNDIWRRNERIRELDYFIDATDNTVNYFIQAANEKQAERDAVIYNLIYRALSEKPLLKGAKQ